MPLPFDPGTQGSQAELLDAYEINYLGHFYLTQRPWPLIKKADKPRIINASSLGHRGLNPPYNLYIHILFDDMQNSEGYDPANAYGRSKARSILFTKELQRKMDEAISKATIIPYIHALHGHKLKMPRDGSQLSDFRHTPFWYCLPRMRDRLPRLPSTPYFKMSRNWRKQHITPTARKATHPSLHLAWLMLASFGKWLKKYSMSPSIYDHPNNLIHH